jgi:hypothetical protein
MRARRCSPLQNPLPHVSWMGPEWSGRWDRVKSPRERDSYRVDGLGWLGGDGGWLATWGLCIHELKCTLLHFSLAVCIYIYYRIYKLIEPCKASL